MMKILTTLEQYTQEELAIISEWGHGKDDEELVVKNTCDLSGNKETLLTLARERKDFYQKYYQSEK